MSYLGNLHVERFKSLHDVSVDLGRVNVFIGANGAGKSNLLEALGILSAAAYGSVDDQTLLRRGVRPGVPRIYKSAFPNATKDPSIRLTATSEGGSRFFIAIQNQGKVPRPYWSFSHERIEDGDGRSCASRGPKAGSASVAGQKVRDERSRSLALHVRANLDVPAQLRTFLDALDDFSIFSAVTPVLRGIAPDTAPRVPVGLFGGGLAEAVDAMTASASKNFKKRALALIDWADTFDVGPPSRELIASSVPAMRSVIRFRDAYMKAKAELSAYDASEGALFVMHLLVLAMHPQSPRLLAVDNFDQALNPALARELARVFVEETLHNKRQVLLTTHNPLVLDGLPLDDDRVRLFRVERRGDGKTEVRRVPVKDLAALKKQHGQHALSRLWTDGRLGGLPRVRAL
ncbi:MAG: ATP-binding protein [Polyangiaceae bacterium]|nr:ATP-binding protein [Polyangiaceae bacterium]